MTATVLFPIGKATPAKLPHGPSARGAKTGVREDLGIDCRSTWEANLCRFYTWLGITFEYEPTTFWFENCTSATRSYTPDFFLPNLNRYVEVKGYMDDRSRTRMRRMQKLYPHIKIELIDAVLYREIEREFSAYVPGWERAQRKKKTNGRGSHAEVKAGKKSRRARKSPQANASVQAM